MLPLFCYATYTSNWPFGGGWFGNISCKISYMMREANKFTSVLTLVALSLDRYLATYQSLSKFRTLRVGRCVCVCIWLAGIVSTTPYCLYAAIESTSRGKSCRVNWPRDDNLRFIRTWKYYQLIVGLILPFSIICLSYIFLLRRLRQLTGIRNRNQTRSKSTYNGSNSTTTTTTLISVPPESTNNSTSRSRTTPVAPKNKKRGGVMAGGRMTKTVMIVFLIFLVCHIPYYTVEMVALHVQEQLHFNNIRPTQHQADLFIYFNVFSQVMVFVSSCCNPILYGVLNKNYRKYRMLEH